MDDITDAIADLTTAFDSFKANTNDQIERLQARLNRPGRQSAEPPSSANFSVDHGALAKEHKALGEFVVNGSDYEIKAMSVDSDPAGGYWVLPQMSATMTKRIFDQSPIRRLSRVIGLDSGDAWQEPIDKNDIGATWVGERETRSATDTADLAMLTVPLNEIWGQQPVTQKLLDTSFVNVGAWIEGKLGDKFGRTEGLAFVSGTGPLQPQGFLTVPTSPLGDLAARPATALQYVMSGAATDITADGLRDLYWTLRAPHRANATWVMASATANAIDKLKSGDGSYLWRDSQVAGMPATLLGRPVEFDENMPAVGAGLYPIIFADWQSFYVVIDRLGLRLIRDPYSSKPNVLFDAYKRVGGGVANTDAAKLMQIGS